jgi:hypothetical protein
MINSKHVSSKETSQQSLRCVAMFPLKLMFCLRPIINGISPLSLPPPTYKEMRSKIERKNLKRKNPSQKYQHSMNLS